MFPNPLDKSLEPRENQSVIWTPEKKKANSRTVSDGSFVDEPSMNKEMSCLELLFRLFTNHQNCLGSLLMLDSILDILSLFKLPISSLTNLRLANNCCFIYLSFEFRSTYIISLFLY